MKLWCSLRYVVAVMMALQASGASASCQKLYPLSDIVEEVGYFATAGTPASAQRLASLRRSMHKNALYQRLEPMGLEAELAAVMRFKIKLGVLIHFALTPGPTTAETYIRTSDFLRSYQPVARLVMTQCNQQVARLEGLAELRMGHSAPTGAGFAVSAAPPDTPQRGNVQLIRTIATGITSLALGAASVGGILYFRKRRRRRRRNTRYCCDLDVTITISPSTFTRSVVDISRSGINVRSKTPLPVDTRVGLKFDMFALGADVVWADDAHAGLKFLNPITEAELQTILEMCRLTGPGAIVEGQTKTAPVEVPYYSSCSRLIETVSTKFTQLRQ